MTEQSNSNTAQQCEVLTSGGPNGGPPMPQAAKPYTDEELFAILSTDTRLAATWCELTQYADKAMFLLQSTLLAVGGHAVVTPSVLAMINDSDKIDVKQLPGGAFSVGVMNKDGKGVKVVMKQPTPLVIEGVGKEV